MKLNKLEKDSVGRYDLEHVPDKINEIIDFLNNSFLTAEPGECFGQVTTMTCDVLTPLENEIVRKVKCPVCGSTHYAELGGSMTLANYVPVYKDGVNVNSDKNTVTTDYECMTCGYRWKAKSL